MDPGAAQSFSTSVAGLPGRFEQGDGRHVPFLQVFARRCRCRRVGVLARSAARAADWGSIKGRFVFDGTPTPPTPIKIDKDVEVCGKHNLMTQDLVVGPDGGVANVVVWVRGKVKVNPEYKKTADDKIVLDNKNCHFIPHVVGVRVGQTLEIKNSDPVAHNTKIDGLNLQVNPLIPAGAADDEAITLPENLPAHVSCSIHQWMSALLVVPPESVFRHFR